MLPRRGGYARHISNVDSAREGDLRVPKPERPPSRSHPVGHGKSVTSSMCNTVDFLSVCCGIQSGTLCRSGFLGSSAFIMVHCADLLPGFFSIYSETLRRYSYTPTIPGQDAPRPLPSPARVLSFFLPAGSVSQRERISVRAVAEEG